MQQLQVQPSGWFLDKMHRLPIAKVKNSILNYNNIRHKHMNSSKVWNKNEHWFLATLRNGKH